MSMRSIQFATALWGLLHPRRIEEAKIAMQVGAIVEDSFGELYEVKRRGDRGPELSPVDAVELPRELGGGLLGALFASRKIYPQWHYAARFFKVVRSPGDEVSEALAGGLKQ